MHSGSLPRHCHKILSQKNDQYTFYNSKLGCWIKYHVLTAHTILSWIEITSKWTADGNREKSWTWTFGHNWQIHQETLRFWTLAANWNFAEPLSSVLSLIIMKANIESLCGSLLSQLEHPLWAILDKRDARYVFFLSQLPTDQPSGLQPTILIISQIIISITRLSAINGFFLLYWLGLCIGHPLQNWMILYDNIPSFPPPLDIYKFCWCDILIDPLYYG